MPKEQMSENQISGNQTQQPLGQILVGKGVISDDQLRIALQEQGKTHQPLGRLLVRLGFLSEATIRDVLSENLGQESVDLASVIIDSVALSLIPKDVARRYQLLPLSVDQIGRILTLAVADPDNIIALDQVRALLKDEYRLITQLASESDILRAIDQYYGFELSIDGILHEIETGEIDYQTLQSGVDEYSQPVVRLIDALLADAVQRGASDIHFEPEQQFPAHPLPHRRRAAPGPQPAQELLAGDGGAPEGDEQHEHRRDPRAAGRPHLAAPVGPADRFPRGFACPPRTARTSGAAHPRPAEGHRAARSARPG